MTNSIRLGCAYCDRSDFDGVSKIPTDWEGIDEVRSFEEAMREVPFDDKTRSVLDRQTHLGNCPECQAIHG